MHLGTGPKILPTLGGQTLTFRLVVRNAIVFVFGGGRLFLRDSSARATDLFLPPYVHITLTVDWSGTHVHLDVIAAVLRSFTVLQRVGEMEHAQYQNIYCRWGCTLLYTDITCAHTLYRMAYSMTPCGDLCYAVVR